MSGTLSLPTTGTFSGLTEQGYINTALAALGVLNQSTTAPTTTTIGLASLAGLVWHDTANGVLNIRDQADSAWIRIGKFDETNKAFVPVVGGLEAGTASAATVDLGAGAEQVYLISGTTTITSFGSSADTKSPIYFVRFNNTLTLTHNATSLILPGGRDIQTAAGDCAMLKYEGSGNWRMIAYQRALMPLARGHQNAAGTAVATSTFTKLLFDTIDFDVAANVSASRFTATIPGYYRVAGRLTFPSTFTGTLALAIYKNGSIYSQSSLGSTAPNQGIEVNDVVFLSATDYIELFGFQASGGSLTTLAGTSAFTSFTIQKLPDNAC